MLLGLMPPFGKPNGSPSRAGGPVLPALFSASFLVNLRVQLLDLLANFVAIFGVRI
jgi:hypothetical protein